MVLEVDIDGWFVHLFILNLPLGRSNVVPCASHKSPDINLYNACGIINSDGCMFEVQCDFRSM